MNIDYITTTITIVYGSQTGTAKFAAEELNYELICNNFKTTLINIENYDYINKLPEEKLIVFIVSTTGYGEFPISMKGFWKFLTNSGLSEESLEDISYGVFGLGDSSYEKYNYSAKLLFKRLEQLGGTSFMPLGLGDDQHDFGWEGEFDPWVKNTVEILKKLLSNFTERIVIDYKPAFNTILLQSNNNYSNSCENDNIKNYKVENDKILNTFNYSNGIEYLDSNTSNKEAYQSYITKGCYICKEDEKDMNNKDKTIISMNLEINIDNNYNYKKEEIFNNFIDSKPGDVLLIYPENDDKSIEKAILMLGFQDYVDNEIIFYNIEDNIYMNIYNSNNQNTTNEFIHKIANEDLKKIVRKYIDKEHKKFKRISIFELFKKYLNFLGVPNRKFCGIISKYATDIVLKDKLILFSSKTSEGKDEFYRYAYREKRTFLDILYDFGFNKEKIMIPLNVVIDSIGFIKPREYSIANLRVLDSQNKKTNNLNDFYKLSIDLLISLKYFYSYSGLKKIGITSRYIEYKLTNFNKMNNNLNKEILDFPFIKVGINKGFFPLIDIKSNFVLIATGTGIAPIIYLLKYREDLINEHISNISSNNIENNDNSINSNNKNNSNCLLKDIGKVILFFGCRYKDYDNIEHEYLLNLSNNNYMNFTIYYAYSRENINNIYNKIYVQTLILKNDCLVCDMLFNKLAKMIIIGNSKTLPGSIEKTLKKIIKVRNPVISELEIENKINLLKLNNQLYVESW